VAGGPQELGVGVAHVEPGDRAALEVPEDGPAGQRVVGVLAHRATVPVSERRATGPGTAVRHPSFTVCILAPIYRSDISVHTFLTAS
jgi:hypothetical protein